MKNIQKVSRKTDEDNLYDRVKAPLTSSVYYYIHLSPLPAYEKSFSHPSLSNNTLPSTPPSLVDCIPTPPWVLMVSFPPIKWGGFGEIALTSQASKLDDLRQHRNISCNAKQFNVQLERLMFCTAIQRNATPFVCTLYHSTLRWAISRNATLFVCTLYHSTLRWAISRNATPFVHKLCYSTLPCAIWRNSEPFLYCIANEC